VLNGRDRDRRAALAAAEAIDAATGRIEMKLSTLALIAALGGGALVAGCADYYGAYPYSTYPDEADYYGYYDGYYGPFYGGYWGPGGYFYYADRGGHHYHRDNGGHFRHDSGGDARYHEVHGRAPQGGGGGRSGGGRDHH
jgi:hypothetical protein